MRTERILNLCDEAHYVPVAAAPQGGVLFEVDLAPGVYRVSGILDARRFDWGRLWLPATEYGNKGQMAGPWDLDFDHVAPLVPAWWAYVNGERVGLACCPRPSVQMLQTKRLTLNWCFHVRCANKVQIRMEPYNSADLDMLHFQIAPDCLQRPERLNLARPLSDASLAKAQAARQVWREWRAKSENEHRQYAAILRAAMAQAKKSWQDPEMLPMLAFAHLAFGDDEAQALMLRSVEALVERPHWGNPHEDGFRHNGDMDAAAAIEPLTSVYHWEGALLEAAGMRDRLREKLALQMSRFFTQILLWDDYWGGSILQDHGHRSCGRFGVGALNMLGVLDEAPVWAEFVAYRMERTVAALPEDGGIPFTSYFKPHLYMDDMVSWRDALRHASGRDIFLAPLFSKIVDFTVNRLDEQTMHLMVATSRGDRKDFYAGWGFFNAIATLHGDRRAARLTELLVQRYTKSVRALGDSDALDGRGRKAFELPQRPVSTLLTAIQHESGVQPEVLEPVVWEMLPQSGLANYRPQEHDVDVAVRCPGQKFMTLAYHTRNLPDSGRDAHLDGHFTVSVKGKTLLLTAEGGGRQRSSLGCALLVDGHGGYGDDTGYSMGYPGVAPRGESVEFARFDERTQCAQISLRLDPVYPREANLIFYRRTLRLQPDGLLCCDTVLASADHDLSWNFHTYGGRSISPVGPGSYRISDGTASVSLTGRSPDCNLASEVGATEVVWLDDNNENNDEEFRRVTFGIARCRCVTAEFVVRW